MVSSSTSLQGRFVVREYYQGGDWSILISVQEAKKAQRMTHIIIVINKHEWNLGIENERVSHAAKIEDAPSVGAFQHFRRIFEAAKQRNEVKFALNVGSLARLIPASALVL